MRVWLSTYALQKMRTKATVFHPLETGGVLLGWRSKQDCVVVDVCGPGPRALHGRHRFLPDHKWQVSQIQRIFLESNGDIDYLGDWHTHPDGVAEMSNLDNKTLRHISNKVHKPIMLIAAGGPAELDWLIAAWNGHIQRSLFYRRFNIKVQEIRVFDAPTI